jgi:hypothetical protein
MQLVVATSRSPGCGQRIDESGSGPERKSYSPVCCEAQYPFDGISPRTSRAVSYATTGYNGQQQGYNVQQQKRCRMVTPEALLDALVFHSGRLILPMRTTYF